MKYYTMYNILEAMSFTQINRSVVILNSFKFYFSRIILVRALVISHFLESLPLAQVTNSI